VLLLRGRSPEQFFRFHLVLMGIDAQFQLTLTSTSPELPQRRVWKTIHLECTRPWCYQQD
jgi:hypothetical protein